MAVKKSPTSQVVINTKRFAQPALAGFANRCTLSERDDVIEFTFLYDRGEDSVVVARIVMPIDDVITRLWQSSKAFYANLKKSYPNPSILKGRIGGETPQVTDTPPVLVNFAGMIRSGIHAQIDCFYVTPRSIHFSKGVEPPQAREKLIEAMPIASIQVATPTLLAMLTHLESLLPRIVERLRVLPDYSNTDLSL